MELKTRLKEAFFTDLPIAGGSGETADDPIIVQRSDGEACRDIEYKVMLYLGIEKKLDWKLHDQAFINTNGRILNQVTVEAHARSAKGQQPVYIKYYFDITDCSPENTYATPPLPDPGHPVNCKPAGTGNHVYRILDAFDIEVHDRWQWHAKDIVEDFANGVIIGTRGGNMNEVRDLARILALDVTRDPFEPDVTGSTPDTTQEMDTDLKRNAENQLRLDNEELIQWLGVDVYDVNRIRCVVCAYVSGSQNTSSDYIEMRFTLNDRKYILQGSYDSHLNNEFEEQIFGALQSLRVKTDTANR